MENNILDKKIISAKEAAIISKNNTWADSVLESSIMPQIKMASTKGNNFVKVDLLNLVNLDTKGEACFQKLKLTLGELGYKVNQEYSRTLIIGW